MCNRCVYRMRLSLRSRRVSCPLRAALIMHALPRDLLVLCGSSGPCVPYCVRRCWPWRCVCSYFVLRNGLRRTTRTSGFAALRVSWSSRCRCVCSCFALRNAARPRPLRGASIPSEGIREPRMRSRCGRIPAALRMRYALVMLRETRKAVRSEQDGMEGVLADRSVARSAASVAQSAFGPLAERLPDAVRYEARSASCRTQSVVSAEHDWARSGRPRRIG